MNPYGSLARKNWQVVAALIVFLVFTAVHGVAFRPVLGRYRADVQKAIAMGMPADGRMPPLSSSRATALLNDNSLNAAVAEEQGTSGTLTASLLDIVTRLAARRDLEVVATEQGVVTQLPTSVQVRAHLKLRGGYGDFAGLIGDLARAHALVAIDRFTIQGGGQPRQDIEVWLSQLVLKRSGGGR